jgi:hypothetical protein
LHFAQAQNSTAGQNITYRGIPTTITKRSTRIIAENHIRSLYFESPDPSDLNGWKKQYHDSESIFVALRNQS